MLQWRRLTARGGAPLEHLSREWAWRTAPPTAADARSRKGNGPVDNLPPWPVDDVEFNTRAPGGGHDMRRAHERELTLLTGLNEDRSESVKGGSSSVVRTREQLKPQPLTEERLCEVREVEETGEGVRALAAGGWVCGGCLRCMPHRSRSVCDHCRAIRHDAATAVSRWRESATTWFCSRCHEFNFDRDVACRCCDLRRDEQTELSVVHHERVLDEVQRSPVGSVIVTRNRVARWRCSSCGESNSLQRSLCRNCEKGRFDFVVRCPGCNASQALSNKQMYGTDPTDRTHVVRPFGMHNCFPRLSPEQRCSVCRSSLHGGAASARSDAWLCACGQVCNSAVVSCTRCRLPRRLPQTTMLEEMLRVWDFAATTNWYCEGCNHANKASRHIVALERHNTPLASGAAAPRGKDTTAVKVARIVHGHTRCEHCGLQWHHQSVNDGQYWRCACHKVNRRDDVRCQVCFLPAVDGIRSDVLSFWSRGDWYCLSCHRQNYREKVTCTCGEARPKD
ncbi:hypothetical protein DQ04_06971030 [Trypanosoma grayi]|uniref:hypothetical protein n=1 Tax=Trypanosoma grayi TaxID=71804 RepID=UPI0004F4335F|nr:hypothetical protein DQ04_06971030 [Trypanosoma grayi]KEG08535.1 hypothetical protein DQ04_06971030 [Trypanosoma grayi]